MSFCRHGSGFITKSSEVFTGIKDTRCPRVFGQPEPAYGILGVADNIKLRYYSSYYRNIFRSDTVFSFSNGGQQGTVSNPFLVVFSKDIK